MSSLTKGMIISGRNWNTLELQLQH